MKSEVLFIIKILGNSVTLQHLKYLPNIDLVFVNSY